MANKNFKISVGSGKGGTGKTTFSTHLADYLSKFLKLNFVDCDVEAPNANIFFKGTEVANKRVSSFIPKFPDICTFCGKCSEVCQFNSISILKDRIIFFPELCHGCKSCQYLCPEQLIKPSEKSVGKVTSFEKENLTIFEGKLNVSEILSPHVIREAISKSEKSLTGLTIIDSPPGTSCGAINSYLQSDLVILVAEPNPFSLNDLKLTVETLNELDKDALLVINKSDENDSIIEEYADFQGIEILGKIPFKKDFAKSYSGGYFFLEDIPEARSIFDKTYKIILEKLL